uniref:Receptor-like serine/threonine-protein kinase n=1 Tax=Capsella orientalis TaxID=945839 RepID=A0A509ELV1_9BRAS|nr:At421370-like [Capsella orientalis]
MRGLRIYSRAYTFSFLLVFALLLLVRPILLISVYTLSSTESLTISSNRTIVSPNGVFELGFFETASNSRWYLGIWYKKVPERTYVWVANRDNPFSTSIGTLKISEANLVLHDHSNTIVWSTNRTGDTRSPVVAELLDTGNFVVRESSNKNDLDRFLWQSFDFPTDTLLPQMKLGWDLKTRLNRYLISWKSPNDPSSGYYSYKLELQGLPEFFLSYKDSPMHRSGPWDGIRFNGIPEKQQLTYMVYNFTENEEEVAYTFSMTNQSILSRLTVSSSGTFDRFTWVPPSWQWNTVWSSPKDECDLYKICGPYSYCDVNTSPRCNCIQGFDPKNQEQWDLSNGVSGCVRRTRLSCREKRFLRLKKMKLPVTMDAIVDRKIGKKECKKRCLTNCNCTAYANVDRSGCLIWTGEFLDIRNYGLEGQDLYVRVAASDLGDEGNKSGKIIGLVVGISIMLLLSFIIIFCWKRKQKRAKTISGPIVYQDRNQDLLMNEVVLSSMRDFAGQKKTEDSELPLMEFKAVLIATDNFSDSNKLGQGGFGIVYKGRLLDGQDIAVKRLSETSTQGTSEFKNEMRLIAKLQHINLVRLLDKTQRAKLNWKMRFEITNGIARGLLYLHQDSRFRIIHRDLKASNILLDKDMVPKISDFGMARIFARDETEANTRKVVGTYGYMSPEYAMDGIFSMKSDVFSFGVLLLEIISGKRNKGFYNSNRDLNLLGCVWRYWKEGKGLEIVDPIVIDPSSTTFRPHEVLRCIQIGLLCVQEHAHDRPTMSTVVLMLGSETIAMSQPNMPGYCVGRSSLETDYSSSEQQDDESCTVNQITISVMDAR